MSWAFLARSGCRPQCFRSAALVGGNSDVIFPMPSPSCHQLNSATRMLSGRQNASSKLQKLNAADTITLMSVELACVFCWLAHASKPSNQNYPQVADHGQNQLFLIIQGFTWVGALLQSRGCNNTVDLKVLKSSQPAVNSFKL
eukprot:1153467-Pelagomonas_calceolata.AAC.3